MSIKNGNYVPPNQYPSETKPEDEDNNIQEKIRNLQSALKSSSKYICCPFCNKQGMTNIEESCSIATGIFCAVGAFIFPTLVQLCRGKDLNCKNAEHYCVGCGNKLASYKSC